MGTLFNSTTPVKTLEGKIMEGLKSGTLRVEDANRLHHELQQCLHRHLTDYSGEQSGSLSKERVDTIFKSFIYIINLYIEVLEDIEAPLDIKDCSIRMLFKEAYSNIQIYIKETYLVYLQVEKVRVPVYNHIYMDTFKKAIPAFFKAYNFSYDATSLVTDIDYPLAQPLPETIQGVKYIRTYLERFLIENEIVRFFKETDIKRLLKRYERVHGIQFEEMPVNIFEIIIENHFFKSLLQQDLLTLGLNHPEQSSFYEHMQGLPALTIEKVLQGALDAYSKACPFFSDVQKQYSHLYLKSRLKAFSAAIELGNTQAIWL